MSLLVVIPVYPYHRCTKVDGREELGREMGRQISYKGLREEVGVREMYN